MTKPPATRQPDARRRQAERLGRVAEAKAAMLLRLKGYRISAQRWKSPAGEIDLIARRGSAVAFVEVKARASAAASFLRPITGWRQIRMRQTSIAALTSSW